MADTAPTCATCPNFTAPMAVQEGQDADVVQRNDIAGVYRYGACRLNPVSERKKPDEVCGQHPALRAAAPDVAALNAATTAMTSLADAIAKSTAKGK